MNRRDFLKFTGLGMGLNLAGVGHSLSRPGEGYSGDRILLLVELNGGNDGLNTVVPYRDPNYYSLRPNIAIRKDQVLPLDQNMGLHPALQPLMNCWDQQELAIVNGVGYPEPNRSHFRSIEIWDTASGSDDVLQDGWVAQLLGNSSATSRSTDGIVIGRNAAPLLGNQMRSVMMQSSKQFIEQSKRLRSTTVASGNAALSHILGVQANIEQTATDLKQRLQQTVKTQTVFPRHRFGRDIKEAAGLIRAGIKVPVIKIAHGSFDTHANQVNQHQRLLAQLAGGLAAFRAEMQEAGLWDRVLVMTYSEFGRRAAENGSKGTDHGTAAPHFMLGGRVRGGFYGQQPALDRLLDKDLQYAVDYRSLYATVAKQWWGLSGQIAQRRYPVLQNMIV